MPKAQPRDPLRSLLAERSFERVITGGEALRAKDPSAPEVKELIQEARLAWIEQAFGAGNLSRAREILDDLDADAPCPERPWLLALTGAFADARAADQYRFYTVADEPLQVAAAWIQEHHDGGLVVTRYDRFGWPVGWWFEGLTDADIAVGSNVKWLGFPDERERALLAERFFERGMTGRAVTELAAETGVELLVFRKWEWIGWERWLSEPSPTVSVAFDDGEFMILDVRDHS